MPTIPSSTQVQGGSYPQQNSSQYPVQTSSQYPPQYPGTQQTNTVYVPAGNTNMYRRFASSPQSVQW